MASKPGHKKAAVPDGELARSSTPASTSITSDAMATLTSQTFVSETYGERKAKFYNAKSYIGRKVEGA